jgi:DNA-binding NtrC family response regulator
MNSEIGLLRHILIVDDDLNFCKSLERALKEELDVSIATNSDESRRWLWKADVVLLDVRLDDTNPHNRDGLSLLSEFRAERPSLPIIMMTAYGDVLMAVDAMKQGAADFLTKPLDLTKLKTALHNALKQAQLASRLASLERDFRRIEPLELVGKGQKIQEIRKIINHIAQEGYINVLITGETGTGKELVARLIHHQGWRVDGPFMAVSLAALSPSIIEREFFGHEKGAFTDAKESKPGYIDQANKGILFLDDIDLAPLEVQAKLLRFLEERTICRLGSTKSIFVDVQIITATNQNIFSLVQEKKFREDLYYRINAIEIHCPPLREHREDIPLLAEHFHKILQKQGRTQVKSLSQEAIDIMMQYEWRGSVRELKNAVEKAALVASFNRHERIEIEDLPADVLYAGKIKSSEAAFPTITKEEPIDLDLEKARFELSLIQSALLKAKGRKTEAFKLLGLNDRFALRRKVKNLARKYPDLLEEFSLIRKVFS